MTMGRGRGKMTGWPRGWEVYTDRMRMGKGMDAVGCGNGDGMSTATAQGRESDVGKKSFACNYLSNVYQFMTRFVDVLQTLYVRVCSTIRVLFKMLQIMLFCGRDVHLPWVGMLSLQRWTV